MLESHLECCRSCFEVTVHDLGPAVSRLHPLGPSLTAASRIAADLQDQRLYLQALGSYFQRLCLEGIQGKQVSPTCLEPYLHLRGMLYPTPQVCTCKRSCMRVAAMSIRTLCMLREECGCKEGQLVVWNGYLQACILI